LPCFLIDPLASIDPDTLKLVDAVSDGSLDLLLVVRTAADVTIPRPLAPVDAECDIRIPLLKPDEARAIARSVLGDAADPSIVEVVAVHGGDSQLGVVEAARTLVASGDVVHDGSRFLWRLAQRSAENRVPLRHLLEERLRLLEPIPSRMLEAACVAPFGFPAISVHRAAALDGLDRESRAHSIARLRQEAFLADDEDLRPSSEALRAVVLRNMPPARLAELHRFLASAVDEGANPAETLIRATLGALRSEGGDAELGAKALLDAAAAAARAGHDRSAVRLAAAAVQCHTTAEVRAAASHITHAVGAGTPIALVRPARASASVQSTVTDARTQPDPTAGVGEEAISALLAGDFE
ncbi:MAG: hypothetical protein H5U40_12320, partial [Polyangiaceae bacterium]|nr:hypothetical protein [Polyangiaceae bacterium]